MVDPTFQVLGTLAVAVGFTLWVQIFQIGPRWFWAQDVCPEPNVTCGNVPVSIIVGVLLGIIVVGLVLGVYLVGRNAEKIGGGSV